MTVATQETSQHRARTALAWRASVAAGVAIVAVRSAMVPSMVGGGLLPLGPRIFDALLPIVVALVMACAAWQARQDSRRLSGAWLLFSLAYLAYGGAELPFAFFAAQLGKSPYDYPSLALYLLFYPLFLLGTLRLPPLPLERRDRTSLALDMGIVMLGAVFLIWSLIVMPAMERGGTELIKVVETVAFPVAGLGVLWSLLTLLFRNLVQPAPAIVRLLAAAAACMIVTDAGYSYHLLFPHPFLWGVLGLGWTGAHVLAGLAPARQLTAVDGVWSPAVGDGRQRAPAGSVYLAYITMMVAVVVMVWLHFRWLSAVGGLALVGMIALGAARKVIGLKENELLKGDLRAARDTLEDRVRERTAELARANVELGLAYDSTLEGWSLALELRDRETQGHTLRVTEMTMQLARELGMDDEELVHVRRGALLHDIGKMGIPDAVLLKPGPLNEEEWEVMRKHPVYAFELLSRISYLRPALDIPYCHHEHWDGSGYPRGLKGVQIPLAARIFSVVDNWDALSRERPYRPAWSAERVRRHIEQHAGVLFDPEVVRTFLASLG